MSESAQNKPVTAQELLVLHPDISVKRTRLGVIEAHRSHILTPRPHASLWALAIDMMLSAPESTTGVRDLRIIGDTRLRAEHDQTIITIPPGTDGWKWMTIEQRVTDPDSMLALAGDAAELLAAYKKLPPDQQWEWRCIGPETSRVYDELRPPDDSMGALGWKGREYTEHEVVFDALEAALEVFGA